MKAIVHSCRTFLGHIPFCGCVFTLAKNGKHEAKNAGDLIKAGIKSDEFVFIKEMIL